MLNFLWSPIFFAAHQIGLAFAVILLLLATVLAFIAVAWRQDRLAAWLFAPYAAWVAFASLLNGYIWILNRPRELGWTCLSQAKRDYGYQNHGERL